jgi:3-oxoacyl-[acyl-carrier-protein] synthase II
MDWSWVHPNLNLVNVDPNCGALDYVTSPGRDLDLCYVMTNNFAFGGINTSIILKKWASR